MMLLCYAAPIIDQNVGGSALSCSNAVIENDFSAETAYYVIRRGVLVSVS